MLAAPLLRAKTRRNAAVACRPAIQQDASRAWCAWFSLPPRTQLPRRINDWEAPRGRSSRTLFDTWHVEELLSCRRPRFERNRAGYDVIKLRARDNTSIAIRAEDQSESRFAVVGKLHASYRGLIKSGCCVPGKGEFRRNARWMNLMSDRRRTTSAVFFGKGFAGRSSARRWNVRDRRGHADLSTWSSSARGKTRGKDLISKGATGCWRRTCGGRGECSFPRGKEAIVESRWTKVALEVPNYARCN